MPEAPRVLALIGKGNNGGDAMLACARLLADFPRARVTLIFTDAPDAMKPLAQKAYEQIEGRVGAYWIEPEADRAAIEAILDQASAGAGVDVCLDGLLGMAFRPPLREPMRTLLEVVNGSEAIALRASVDLPSGKGDVSDAVCFRADFTYATGIAKQVVFQDASACGRVRYIDLGFFEYPAAKALDVSEYVLSPQVLRPLQRFRPASSEKRRFGHLFILGGSVYMPGALQMAVQAAVRSGVGLVTVFAPASVVPTLSAQIPEAMWVPWPETRHGTLSPQALPLLMDRIGRATAVLCGPGMGRNRGTELLIQNLVKQVELPVLLDADALRSKVIELVPKRKPGFGPVVVTPHMGEFMRIAKLSEPDDSVETLNGFCSNYRVITVLKGTYTRICDGASVLYHIHGGSVLSRGGSGDLLAGIMGGMMAQNDVAVGASVARAVALHGLAAQRLARSKGQVAVRTTQLLDYLPEVLRSELA